MMPMPATSYSCLIDVETTLCVYWEYTIEIHALNSRVLTDLVCKRNRTLQSSRRSNELKKNPELTHKIKPSKKYLQPAKIRQPHCAHKRNALAKLDQPISIFQNYN